MAAKAVAPDGGRHAQGHRRAGRELRRRCQHRGTDRQSADEAILKEIEKRQHNLIVMGVERRPGEKLFFGETATAILEKSDRSIVFVVS